MKGIYIIQAIKEIYPNIEGGFAYWETKQDGSDWESPIDGLIWENAQFEKPTWSQIDALLPSSTTIKKERKKESLILSRKKYLNNTDFRVLRFIDEGMSYPDEIKTKRIQARREINDIEAATTLAALNEFSEVFE